MVVRLPFPVLTLYPLKGMMEGRLRPLVVLLSLRPPHPPPDVALVWSLPHKYMELPPKLALL